jgi:uncharacterized membrane protein YidH (DUF202 family)
MATPSHPPNDPANSPGSSSPGAAHDGAGHDGAGHDQGDVDDLDERDPGLAAERTSLAWTRTAISFAALGGAVLKASVVPGLIIILMAPLVWRLGHLRKRGPYRLWLIAVSIVAVATLALLVATIGHGASRALRP